MNSVKFFDPFSYRIKKGFMHAIDFHLPQDVLGFLEKYANPDNYKVLMESPRSVSLFVENGKRGWIFLDSVRLYAGL